MTQSELIVRVLIEGAIGALFVVAVAFLLSRFAGDGLGRSLLVIFLLVAAGAYFGFAVMARVGPGWLLAELAQCVLFGAVALRGLRRGSPLWLAAAWALHPVWDFGLHYAGPGTFAPWPYAVACVSFDLVVAAYVALAYGLIGARRLGLRNAE